jgi:hypothetical protein
VHLIKTAIRRHLRGVFLTEQTWAGVGRIIIFEEMSLLAKNRNSLPCRGRLFFSSWLKWLLGTLEREPGSGTEIQRLPTWFSGDKVPQDYEMKTHSASGCVRSDAPDVIISYLSPKRSKEAISCDRLRITASFRQFFLVLAVPRLHAIGKFCLPGYFPIGRSQMPY